MKIRNLRFAVFKHLNTVFLLLPAFLFLVPYSCYSQFLTIYHNDLAYFQEIKTFQLSAGKQWVYLKDFPETADLNSILVFPGVQNAVKILEQRIVQPYDQSQIFLFKSLHKEIELVITEDTNLRGVLEDIAPDVLMVKDSGGLIHLVNRTMIKRLIAAGDSDYTAAARAGWFIESPSVMKAQFAVSYFLSGFSWKVRYTALSMDKTRRLKLFPHAAIKNNTKEQINAGQVWLIAGDVQRQNNNSPPFPRGTLQKAAFSVMDASTEEAVHEEKYEYHSYRLAGPVVIEPQSEILKPLMEEKDVSVYRKYIFDGERYANSVRVLFTLKNTVEEGLGLALPTGQITVYQLDEHQNLIFLCEDNFPATPEGKDVSFSGGITFDFTGERSRSYFKQVSINTVEEGYKIHLRNASSHNDTVYVAEHLRGDWKILQSSHTFKQRDSQSIEFIVPVAKKSEAVLTFNVKIA